MQNVSSLSSLNISNNKLGLFAAPFNIATEIPWRNLYSAELTQTTPFTPDGVVAQWDDSVGGKHVLQGTAGLRPTYRSSLSVFNGKPGIEFDGDFLQLASATFGTITQPVSILTLISLDSPDSSTDVFIGSASATTFSVGKVSSQYNLNAGSSFSAGTVGSNTQILLAASFTPQAALLFDGTATVGAAGANSLAGLTIGGDNSGAASAKFYINFVGIYPGIFGFDGVIKASTIERLYRYCANRGAVTP